jgi:orotate phosphoribosyltransferase
MDLETLCLRPAAIQPFAAQIADRLRALAIDVVCGPLNEGAFVALLVAATLDCEFAYAERFVGPRGDALYPVAYRLPPMLRPLVDGKRVAIVNDVISAGSAVRGTFADLESLGARIVAVGALLVLGPSMAAFAGEHGIQLEALAHEPLNLWTPAECPLCRAGVALEAPGT